LTEPAGDIIFNCTQTSAVNNSQATITLEYQGIPITNSTAYPAAKPISVPAGSNNCAAAIPAGNISVSNASGQVVVTVPANMGTGAGTTCSFTVTGVLLALSGSGATSVNANVSVSPGNQLLITAGQNVATVITSVLPGLRVTPPTPSVTLGPGLVLTTGATVTPGSATFTITTTENYIDMFRDDAQFNGGAATQGVQISHTFSGIPTGVTLGGCTAGTAGGAGTMATFIVGGATTITSGSPTIVIEVGGVPDLAAIESVTLTCTTFTAGATATIPLTPGAITATVTLAPTGNAFSATGAVLTGATTGQIPRYTSSPSTAVTALTIISATTHMLFPYVAIGDGFDSGFVITNTTADPYGFTSGAVNTTGGARALAGPVTLAFYPTPTTAGTTVSPFCVSTAAGAASVAGITSCTIATPGIGLVSGAVPSGSSWIVLGSQVTSGVTSAPAVFRGYVFGISNFPYAHPTVFVADATFSGKFTAGGPGLVLPNPSVLARTGGSITSGGVTLPLGFSVGLVESLGH
jgi:hypothetical protein